MRTVEEIFGQLEAGYLLEEADYPDLIDRTVCRRATDADVFPLMTPKLCAMPYEQFLETPYWRIVRARMLGHDQHPWYRLCERCRSRQASEVHHNSYRNRGKEWLHTEDLEALCSLCHSSGHAKQPRLSAAVGVPEDRL